MPAPALHPALQHIAAGDESKGEPQKDLLSDVGPVGPVGPVGSVGSARLRRLTSLDVA